MADGYVKGSFAVDPLKKYSYADYLTWPDDERWEIIEGKAWDMSPAPTTSHQIIVVELTVILGNYLKGKKCRVLVSPFDVRLLDEESDSVVQPDLSVICDPSKLDKQGCKGAPDIVIEILSPSTAFKDETRKFKLYEKHKVREYWIINPETYHIMVYAHTGSEYAKPDYYRKNDILKSQVLEDLEIPLAEVFSELESLEETADRN